MAVNNTKKRLVTSIHNLTPAQQAEIKALYPLGFAEVMQRIDKPDGTFFCVVPYETEDTYYLVKIDVKVDDGHDDENDGYYDEDDLKGAEDDIQKMTDKFTKEIASIISEKEKEIMAV